MEIRRLRHAAKNYAVARLGFSLLSTSQQRITRFWIERMKGKLARTLPTSDDWLYELEA